MSAGFTTLTALAQLGQDIAEGEDVGQAVADSITSSLSSIGTTAALGGAGAGSLVLAVPAIASAIADFDIARGAEQDAESIEHGIEDLQRQMQALPGRFQEFFQRPDFAEAVQAVPARAMLANNLAENIVRRGTASGLQGILGFAQRAAAQGGDVAPAQLRQDITERTEQLLSGTSEGLSNFVGVTPEEVFRGTSGTGGTPLLESILEADPVETTVAGLALSPQPFQELQDFGERIGLAPEMVEAIGDPKTGAARGLLRTALSRPGGLPEAQETRLFRSRLGLNPRPDSIQNAGAASLLEQGSESPFGKLATRVLEAMESLEGPQDLLDRVQVDPVRQQVHLASLFDESPASERFNQAAQSFLEGFEPGTLGIQGIETGGQELFAPQPTLPTPEPPEGETNTGSSGDIDGTDPTDGDPGMSFDLGNFLGSIDLGDLAGSIDLGDLTNTATGFLDDIDLGDLTGALDDLLGPVDDTIIDAGGDVLGGLGDILGGAGGAIGDLLGSDFLGDLVGIVGDIFGGGSGSGGGGGAGGGGTGSGAGGGGTSGSDLLSAILPSLLGAGAGLLGDDGEPARAGTINPAFPRIAEAFGVGTTLNDSGLFAPSGGTAASIFGPTQMGSIRDFLQNPVGPTGAEATANSILAGEPVSGALGDAFTAGSERFDDLLGAAVPSTVDLIETGAPTAVDPIVEESQRRFREDFLPSLFERLPTGTLASSGIPALASREASRIASELGQLEFEAGESAAGRRMDALTGALPTVSTANAAASQFPISFASDLFSVGSQARQAAEDVRPGSRLFQGFTTLSGLGPNRIVTQGAHPSDLSQILSALSQTIPAGTITGSGGGGFGNPFSDLFG